MDDYWDYNSPQGKFIRHRQYRLDGFNEIVQLVDQGQEAISSLIEEDPTKINEIQSNGYTLLQVAVHEGNKDLVQFLLNQGADIHVRGYNDETALHLACVKRHKDIVKMLLDGGSQVNQRDDYWGNTALHYAAQSKDEEIVKLLLDKGVVDINVENKHNKTALDLAIEKGPEDIVKLLLKQGAAVTGKYKSIIELISNNGIDDINTQKYNFEESLRMACYSRQVDLTDIVKLLIDRGIDVISIEGFEQCLKVACKYGYADIVKELLDRAPKPNLNKTILRIAARRDDRSVLQELWSHAIYVYLDEDLEWTVLQLACEAGHKQVVQLLIDYGANLNAIDERGDTTLCFAVRGGNPEIFELILNHGFKNDLTNIYSKTVLLEIASREGHEEMLKILLESDNLTGEEFRESYGSTALFCAVEGAANRNIVTMLLDRGIEVDATNDNKGESALHLACAKGSEDLVQLLVERGANVMIGSDKQGKTLLHSAAFGGNKNTVKFFLDQGIEVNAINYNGESALHLACEKGSDDVVELLLEFGADIFAENNIRRETALELAFRKGLLSTAKLLFNKGADIERIIDTRVIPKKILLDKVKNFFTAVTLAEGNEYLPILPVLCVHEIFTYLNNRDLISLIKVCKTIDESDLMMWGRRIY